jgi:hypothetical protein
MTFEPKKDKTKKELEESKKENIELREKLESLGSVQPYTSPITNALSHRRERHHQEKESYHLELSTNDKAWIYGVASGSVSFISTFLYYYNNSFLGVDHVSRVFSGFMAGLLPLVLIGGLVYGLTIELSQRIRKY